MQTQTKWDFHSLLNGDPAVQAVREQVETRGKLEGLPVDIDGGAGADKGRPLRQESAGENGDAPAPAVDKSPSGGGGGPLGMEASESRPGGDAPTPDE